MAVSQSFLPLLLALPLLFAGTPVAPSAPAQRPASALAAACGLTDARLQGLADAGVEQTSCITSTEVPDDFLARRVAGGVTSFGLEPGTIDDIPAQCFDTDNVPSRTQLCETDAIIYTIFQTPSGAVVGYANIFFLQAPNTRLGLGRTWRHEVYAEVTEAVGLAAVGTELLVDLICSTNCAVTERTNPSAWTPVLAGSSLTGRWDVRSPGTAIEYTSQTLQVGVRNAVATPPHPTILLDPIATRCDSEPGNTTAGCAFNEITAVFTLSVSDPSVNETAQHIALAQFELPGSPGSLIAGNPLTRLTDPVARVANRTAACQGFVPARPRDQCDEYPFASTYQGAALAGPGNFSVASVAGLDNTTAGGRLGAFYQRNRIYDGEEFYVDIE